jgi:hypothetical protein
MRVYTYVRIHEQTHISNTHTHTHTHTCIMNISYKQTLAYTQSEEDDDAAADSPRCPYSWC